MFDWFDWNDFVNVLLAVAVAANVLAFLDSLRRLRQVRSLTKQLHAQIARMEEFTAKQEREHAERCRVWEAFLKDPISFSVRLFELQHGPIIITDDKDPTLH